jgi:phosphomannomutase
MKLSLQELMAKCGVTFGTSGARGLVTAMTDFVCYAYTRGFLQHLESIGDLRQEGTEVAVAGDLRPSTDRIMEAICRAAEDLGYTPLNCGKIPSPAVALYGLVKQIPAIMVTGSHIPADRNGIKFNKNTGEILKEDEAGITRQVVSVEEALFDAKGAFRQTRPEARPVDGAARAAYLRRYLDCFPHDALKGLRLGVYQHSAVGREMVLDILRGLGAEATPLGLAHEFIPVDTEAIRPEDARLAREWAQEHRFDAIVSTDGDSDRPLISDEHGQWLRGDVAGILCAKYLQADSVSVPVSCNTAVDKCGWFKQVRRTRIGSPFVIASMLEASAQGARRVVGYEANGGFLINCDLPLGLKTLRALPTRDAMILLLSVLLLARAEDRTVFQLCATLPARFTASDRLKDIPPEKSRAILDRFSTDDEAADQREIEAVFRTGFGRVASLDRTDGLRITFESGEIAHLRPSGNAPEFRCYNEAASEERVRQMSTVCMDLIKLLAE